MPIKGCIVVLLSFVLVACGGATRAPVQDRSLSTTAQPSPNQYVVRKGDTLYSIAFRYGLDYRQLAANNGINQNYSIYPGQRLNLKVEKPRVNESIIRDASISAPKVKIVRNSEASSEKKPSSAQVKETKPKVNTVTQSTQKARQVQPAPKKEPAKSPRTSVPIGPIKWQWPASGKVIAQYRTKGAVNKGINISGAKGSSVKAAARGKVVYAGNGLLGYGNLVIIDHNQQYLSAYAHNSRVLVKESDIVKAGQKIAEMGSTGADRIMLHFEIRRDGKPMNPLRYLPKR